MTRRNSQSRQDFTLRPFVATIPPVDPADFSRSATICSVPSSFPRLRFSVDQDPTAAHFCKHAGAVHHFTAKSFLTHGFRPPQNRYTGIIGCYSRDLTILKMLW
jgi:hypothetical protein